MPADKNACRACGTWICLACGAKRQRANRWSAEPQVCPNTACGSLEGVMRPVVHFRGRAEDHDEWVEQEIAKGRVWRYPLEVGS